MSIHRFLLPSFLVAALLSSCGPHQDSTPQPSPWQTHYHAGEEALQQGDYAQAETFYRRAIAAQKKTVGNHPELARTLDNYALLLRKSKRDPEARAAEDRARQIRHTDEHPTP